MTTVHLLDVNLLLALAWAHHEHHERALAWFARSGRRRWATAAITELGFVRISSNHRFRSEPATTTTAVAALRQMQTNGKHQFLGELTQRELHDLYGRSPVRHAQVTDLYLLGLCAKHGAALATFDQGMPPLAERLDLDVSLVTPP